MLDHAVIDPTAFNLLDASPAAICLADVSGRVTYFNEAAANLWGHKPALNTEDWPSPSTLRFPDGRPMSAAESPALTAVKDGRGSKDEVLLERPDGSLIPIMAFSSPTRDDRGAITGAFIIMIDISERKKADEATFRLAAIVESSDDAIVSKTLDGVITSWNMGAQRLFGYCAHEAIGRHISLIIPKNRKDEENSILERIRIGERVNHFDTIRQHKDGTLLHVSLTISPIKNAAGKIIGASKIARDVSDRKETEGRIRLLLREVNHRVKNQFAVILSMIRETNKRAVSSDDFEQQVRERIMALARSHDLLVEDDWRGAKLAQLVVSQLEPFATSDRFEVAGESLTLSSTAVQYLGIAFHELATNSAKYGALSAVGGTISVTWSRTGDDKARLRLIWKEKGGPSVQEPSRKGFGRVVLERVTPAAVDGVGHLSYDPDGVTWTLDAPVASLTAFRVE